ncbi:hypothetical protein B0H13DRAFT_2363295 [Mycena leptocephala]|nr:hypothetical protein B0H13DRAFT_2363295 [Mycena leptocephala]
MTRTSARKISGSIAKLAAQDLASSDDELMMDVDDEVDIDLTLVPSDDEKEQDKPEQEPLAKEEDNDEDEDDEDEEEDDDKDDEEEEEEEEDVAIGKKRKRVPNRVSPKAPAPREIEYSLSTFTYEEMKKSNDEHWSTLKTQILTKINGLGESATTAAQ